MWLFVDRFRRCQAKKERRLKPLKYVFLSLKGTGFSPSVNYFVVNAALAAEGAIFHQPRLFPQPPKSCPDTKHQSGDLVTDALPLCARYRFYA
jgi:hypothetical protein